MYLYCLNFLENSGQNYLIFDIHFHTNILLHESCEIIRKKRNFCGNHSICGIYHTLPLKVCKKKKKVTGLLLYVTKE